MVLKTNQIPSFFEKNRKEFDFLIKKILNSIMVKLQPTLKINFDFLIMNSYSFNKILARSEEWLPKISTQRLKDSFDCLIHLKYNNLCQIIL